MSAVTISISEPPEQELDVLGDTLAAMRFRGTSLYRSEMVAPWGVKTPCQSEMRGHFSGGDPNSRVVMFHVVVEGEVVMGDDDGEEVVVRTGDIVIFAGGHRHEVRQGNPTAPIPVEGMAPTPGATVTFGEGPPTAVMMCGLFILRDTELNPLLDALPDMLVLKHDSRSAALYEMLVTEFATPGAGRNALLDRAAEMLFILAVRDVANVADRAPWFRAIEDPHVGRAIRLIHADPAADWSVEKLASAAGVSRSGLAARFRATLGLSPGKYLTRWRMNLATRLLNDRSLGLAEVAQQVGYTSEFAFSRTFKRHLGMAPSLWRKR